MESLGSRCLDLALIEGGSRGGREGEKEEDNADGNTEAKEASDEDVGRRTRSTIGG